jgi:hypothetical protein
MDDDGFAPESAWIRASMQARHPAALPRIVRGHTTITLNPAPILVSVAVGYRVGFGFVSVANRLRPLGGTHGALDSTSALGVVMTTFRDTHDDVTSSVRLQLDAFADLGAPQRHAPVARLTTGARLAMDPRGAFREGLVPTDAEGPGVVVTLAEAATDQMRLVLALRPSLRALPDVGLAWEQVVDFGRAVASSDPRVRFLPFARLDAPHFEAGRSFSLHIQIDPGDGSAGLALPTLTVRTGPDGRLIVH